jgi:hypothetical protein
VRLYELASPIADETTFKTIVQLVITDNPFARVLYMTTGIIHDPVEKTREGYSVKKKAMMKRELI